MIVVLMGVSGSGKTTIGKLLAERTGWIFADADDYFPRSCKQKMAAGHPLTDGDRVPWLRLSIASCENGRGKGPTASWRVPH